MIRRLIKSLKSFDLEYPPGHYYSPVITPTELKSLGPINFAYSEASEIPGINLNAEEQFRLLERMLAFYPSVPFQDQPNDKNRYYFDNDFFSYNSGIQLYCLLRLIKPGRIVEVGSGFSSALMLDVNELYFEGKIQLQFIEPYPGVRLKKLLRKADYGSAVIIEKRLQEVDLSIFKNLNRNDVLFVDSSHVSKPGSDVNRLFFEILPILKPGVIVHFHDIFFPFEYPRGWVNNPKGFGWNELYMLRSFLMHNDQYKILFFNSYLEMTHEKWFRDNMPLCLTKQGGSLFIVKN